MPDRGTPDDDEAASSRKTVAAAVVIAVLIVLGWWLMNDLQRHREIETCIESGRRDCIPIEPGK